MLLYQLYFFKDTGVTDILFSGSQHRCHSEGEEDVLGHILISNCSELGYKAHIRR
jgi:hypothetical protein